MTTAPVEEIRRAAHLMRERAQAARSVPDEFWLTYFSSTEGRHFASWHPGVVLKIADLFDRIAWTWELDPDLQGRVGGDELLAAAREYLGGGAS